MFAYDSCTIYLSFTVLSVTDVCNSCSYSCSAIFFLFTVVCNSLILAVTLTIFLALTVADVYNSFIYRELFTDLGVAIKTIADE